MPNPNEQIVITLVVDDQGTRVVQQFTKQVEPELKKVEKQAKQTGKTMEETGRGMGQVLSEVGRRMTITSTVIAGGMMAAMKKTIDFGHELNIMSQRTGITTETLSSFRISADKSGTSITAISKGIRTLNTEMYKASRGSYEATRTFTNLGISIKDSTGKMKSATQLVYDMADKFSKMEDETEKTSLAMKLFGRYGMELIPMLNLGSKGLREDADAAKRLGVVMSKDAAESADQLSNKLTLLKASSQGVYMQFMQSVIPVLQTMTVTMTSIITKVKDWVATHPALTRVVAQSATVFLMFATSISPMIWTLGRMVRTVHDLHDAKVFLIPVLDKLTATFLRFVPELDFTATKMNVLKNTVGNMGKEFAATWSKMGWITKLGIYAAGAFVLYKAYTFLDGILFKLANGYEKWNKATQQNYEKTLAAEAATKRAIIQYGELRKALDETQKKQDEIAAKRAQPPQGVSSRELRPKAFGVEGYETGSKTMDAMVRKYSGDITKMMDDLEKGSFKATTKMEADFVSWFNVVYKKKTEQAALEAKAAAQQEVLNSRYKQMEQEKAITILGTLLALHEIAPANKEIEKSIEMLTKKFRDDFGEVEKITREFAESKGIFPLSKLEEDMGKLKDAYMYAFIDLKMSTKGIAKALGEAWVQNTEQSFTLGKTWKDLGRDGQNLYKVMLAGKGAASVQITSYQELNGKIEEHVKQLKWRTEAGLLNEKQVEQERLKIISEKEALGEATIAERAYADARSKGKMVTGQLIEDMNVTIQAYKDTAAAVGTAIAAQRFGSTIIEYEKLAKAMGVTKGDLKGLKNDFFNVIYGVKTATAEYSVQADTVEGLRIQYQALAKGMKEQEAGATAEWLEKQNFEIMRLKVAAGDAATAERGMLTAHGMGIKTTRELSEQTKDLNAAVGMLDFWFAEGTVSSKEYTKTMADIVKAAEEAGTSIKGLTEAEKYFWLAVSGGMQTLEQEQELFKNVAGTAASLSEKIGKEGGISIVAYKKVMEDLISKTKELNPELAKTLELMMMAELSKSGSPLQQQIWAAERLGVTLKTMLIPQAEQLIKDFQLLANAGQLSKGEMANAIQTVLDSLKKLGSKNPIKDLATKMKMSYDDFKAAFPEFEDMMPEFSQKDWEKWVKDNMNPQYFTESIQAAFQFLAGVGQVWAENFAQEADAVRASITDAMGYAERAAVEHKAVQLENMGALVSGISLAGGNIAKDLTKAKVEADGLGAALLEAVGPQVMGMIGGAIGQMISGAKNSFASLGSSIGGAIGSIFGPVGSAIGSFVGGIFGGLFKKKKTPEQLAAEQYQKWVDEAKTATSSLGKISSSTAKAIADFRKEMKDAGKNISESAAQAYLLNTIMQDVGLTLKNVNKFWSEGIKIVDEYKKGQLTAKQATESLTSSFQTLIEAARRFGTEGSNAMVDFIAKVKESGLEVKEVTEYIQAQLGIVKQETGSAAGRLLKMATYYMTGLEELYAQQVALQTQLEDRLLRGMAKVKVQQELAKVKKQIADLASGSEADLERLGERTFSVFAEMVLEGASFNEAMASLGPTLDLIIRRYEIMGKEVPGSLKDIAALRKYQNAHKELFDAIQGNLDVLTATSNIRHASQKEIDDSATTMRGYYDTLIAGGLSEQQALVAIQPTLERLVYLQKEYAGTKYAISIDAKTQALIDQADALGMIKKEQLSLNEVVLGGFALLIEAMGKQVPDALMKYRDKLINTEAEEGRRQDRMDERRRQAELDRGKAYDDGKLGVAGYTDAVVDSTTRIDSGITTVIDDLGKTSDGFRDAGDRAEDSLGRMESGIEGVRTSLEDANASLENFATNLAAMGIDNGGINVQTNTSQEPTISGAGGGAWQVLGREQLFRAHQGETVRIDRGEGGGEDISAILNRLEAVIQSRPVVQQDVTINVSTLDADSFKKVTVDKLVPELMKLSKAEKFKTHPNSVRSY